jgi:hypothetical protein
MFRSHVNKNDFITAMAAERTAGALGSSYRIPQLCSDDLERVSTPVVLHGGDIVVYKYTFADGPAIIIVPADAGGYIEDAVLLV